MFFEFSPGGRQNLSQRFSAGKGEKRNEVPEGRPSSRRLRVDAPYGLQGYKLIKPAQEFDMAETKSARTKCSAGLRIIVATLLATVFSLLSSQFPARAADQPGAECLACHGDKSMTTIREPAKRFRCYVDGKKFAASVHASFGCTGCHADMEGKDLPHEAPLTPVKCGTCHTTEQEQHARSLHGKAIARGDALAPHCVNCHGNHDIVPVKDPRSAVAPAKSSLRLRPVPSRRNAGFAQSRRLPRTIFWRTTPRASTERPC